MARCAFSTLVVALVIVTHDHHSGHWFVKASVVQLLGADIVNFNIII